MRFPFTFMGLMAIAFGAWILLFVALHRAGLPALAGALVMLGFGGFVLYRRLSGRET